ncbi:hypothetical protein B0H19DRAFT_1082590 [Mycena capillaripes]|nr:hypothetical protein B0H19DRAFT_1082590 [Mycena capillaripes]
MRWRVAPHPLRHPVADPVASGGSSWVWYTSFEVPPAPHASGATGWLPHIKDPKYGRQPSKVHQIQTGGYVAIVWCPGLDIWDDLYTVADWLINSRAERHPGLLLSAQQMIEWFNIQNDVFGNGLEVQTHFSKLFVDFYDNIRQAEATTTLADDAGGGLHRPAPRK